VTSLSLRGSFNGPKLQESVGARERFSVVLCLVAHDPMRTKTWSLDRRRLFEYNALKISVSSLIHLAVAGSVAIEHRERGLDFVGHVAPYLDRGRDPRAVESMSRYLGRVYEVFSGSEGRRR
jgi:hypothetical protein